MAHGSDCHLVTRASVAIHVGHMLGMLDPGRVCVCMLVRGFSKKEPNMA